MYATRMHHAISRICYHMLERIDYVGIPILDLHACHGAVYTCAYQPQDVYIHVEIYILYFTCLLVLACISKQYIHYLYVYIGTGASIGGRSTTAETQLLQKILGHLPSWPELQQIVRTLLVRVDSCLQPTFSLQQCDSLEHGMDCFFHQLIYQ